MDGKTSDGEGCKPRALLSLSREQLKTAEQEHNEEQQQELKESIVRPSEFTMENLEKQVLELEKLKVQEEQYQAQQALEAAAAAQKPEPAVAEPTPAAPAPAPVSAGRRIHPNYRSSFTIGGSR